jgi:hypothetical protein
MSSHAVGTDRLQLEALWVREAKFDLFVEMIKVKFHAASAGAASGVAVGVSDDDVVVILRLADDEMVEDDARVETDLELVVEFAGGGGGGRGKV